MALIDTVRSICQRLASGGWDSLFALHGLDLAAADLQDALAAPLTIDRTVPGFEDFALEGTRGIEPGNLAQSLLFHALASPRVRTDGNGNPLTLYPSPGEIEAVENYVYGVQPPTLAEIRNRAGASAVMAIVVFASEYRPANETVHRRHADLCLSRTGVARVGTKPALYSPEERGYLPFVDGDASAIRVLPARYSAYLAVKRRGARNSFGPMRFRATGSTVVPADGDLDFWVPLHKLFPGTECISGFDLDVTLRAHHVNEKLRRVHLRFGALGQDGGWREPDISQSPFIFHDRIAELSTAPNEGAGLLMPTPHAALVEEAQYQGSVLTFRVPPGSRTFSSSLYLPGLGDGEGARQAPEYVHARQRVRSNGTREDLNDRADPEGVIAQGNYRAVHYLDFTGDGFISAESVALATEFPRRVAAYSMVTAPDFFPSADQRELSEWTQQSVPQNLRRWTWAVPPDELSNVRMPPNLQIPGAEWEADDLTACAIVSFPRATLGAQAGIIQDFTRAHSMLPDAAAGVFAPGWDTSFTLGAGNVAHLAAFGLGSPFPEDAKLCAALSTFWPSVAPDAARTFEDRQPTVAPLTDEEIGITGNNPWDGVKGPVLVGSGSAARVEYTRLSHADYILNALAGKISLALTGRVDLPEYKRRVLAMARAYEAMFRSQLISTSGAGTNGRASWSVLSYRERAVGDAVEFADAQQAAQSTFGSGLEGSIIRMVLIRPGQTTSVPGDVTKVRVAIQRRVIMYISNLRLCLKIDGGAWKALNV